MRLPVNLFKRRRHYKIMVEFSNNYRRWHLVYAKSLTHAISIGFNAFPTAAAIIPEIVE